MPLLESKKGFLVSWFSFSMFDSWFLVCLRVVLLVLLCLGFFVSKRSLMFSEDICYILPHFDFHVFDRYWSHIQDSPDFITRIFIIVRRASFRKVQAF